jgi:hypothetical protein
MMSVVWQTKMIKNRTTWQVPSDAVPKQPCVELHLWVDDSSGGLKFSD